MEAKGAFNIEPIAKMLRLIERVIKTRELDRQHHRDEFEKHFNYLLQGKDTLNPYERRQAGVTDEEWEAAKEEFKLCLKIK